MPPDHPRDRWDAETLAGEDAERRDRDEALTDRIAERGAERFAELLRRLGDEDSLI